MFYIVKEMRFERSAQIARDLDRDYEAVLNYVHKVQEVSGDIDDFSLSDVCEADEASCVSPDFNPIRTRSSSFKKLTSATSKYVISPGIHVPSIRRAKSQLGL